MIFVGNKKNGYIYDKFNTDTEKFTWCYNYLL